MSRHGRSAVLRRRYCPACKQNGVTQLHSIEAADGGLGRAFVSSVPERLTAIFNHQGCGGGNPAFAVDLRGNEYEYLRKRWGAEREYRTARFMEA